MVKSNESLINSNEQEIKTNNKYQSSFNLINWMSNHRLETVSKKRISNDTATKYVLKQCPWKSEHPNGSAYIIQYDTGVLVAGCDHLECCDNDWISLRDKLELDSKNVINRPLQDSQADILVKVGEEAKLYCDDIETAFAAIEVNNHVEIYKVKSERFKLWLTKKYYEKTGKAPGTDAMNQALGVFQMKAIFDGEKRSFSKRCAKYGGKYYYDLADKDWQTIEIDNEGWRVLNQNPLLFIRNNNMKAQVLPVENDDLSILDKHFRYKNESDAILHKVDLVTKFIADICHPLSVIHGEKGASKTTTMRKDRSIVDPAARDIVSMPTSKDDLAIILNNNYMPSFDNLDNITPEKSDLLCMAATGGSFSKRALYSNDEETILTFKVPVCLNGINVVATRADLLDRSILFELERISPEERKEESVVWEEFERDKPKILGAIFSTLSKAMRIYDTIKLDKMGRMADFGRWGFAIAEAAGIDGQVFIDAYLSNQTRANEEAVESNPIALAVIKLMNECDRWDGSVSELLRELQKIAEEECIDIHNRLWAKEANVLSRRLKEVKSNLESIEIRYNIRHLSKAKYITLTKGNASVEEEATIDDRFDQLFNEGESIII